MALSETTEPCARASRSTPSRAVIQLPGPVQGGIRITRMAAPGATACTISVSSTSSPPASHGQGALYPPPPPQPRPGRAGQAGVHLQPRGGQAKHGVKQRQVLADVSD